MYFEKHHNTTAYFNGTLHHGSNYTESHKKDFDFQATTFFSVLPRATQITESVVLSLCIALVAARFWSRALLPTSRFGWDDACMLAASVALIIHFSANGSPIVQSLFVGLHDKPPNENGSTYLILYIQSYFRPFLLNLPRLSILLFYRRVFHKQQTRTWKIIWIIVFSACVAWLVSSIFVSAFACVPVHKIWEHKKYADTGSCINNEAWYISEALIGSAIVLAILAIPIPYTLRLGLSSKRRLLLGGVFLCGIAEIAVAIVRLVFLVVKDVGRLDLNAVPTTVLLQAQIGLSFMAVCLPVIYHLFERAKEHGFTSLFKREAPPLLEPTTTRQVTARVSRSLPPPYSEAASRHWSRHQSQQITGQLHLQRMSMELTEGIGERRPTYEEASAMEGWVQESSAAAHSIHNVEPDESMIQTGTFLDL